MQLPTDITHLVVLGLAVARLTSLVVIDDIMEPIRHRVFTWSPPYDDADRGLMYQSVDLINGTSTALRDPGFLGRLVSCYHCTGIWVSFVAALSVVMIPAYAWPLLTVLAVAQFSDTSIKLTRGH